MIISKKTAALAIIIGAIIGYEFSKTYVPEDFERPLYFKTKHLIMKLSGNLAKFGASLNIGTEASNFRFLLSFLTSSFTFRDYQVDIVNTKLNNVPVRIYNRKAFDSKEKAIIIFFHGGGFAFGDLATYDLYLYDIVKRIDSVIISVDYRLAPENPYPAPIDDCFTVTQYVINNPAEFNADINKLILAGDSAGGTAVAVITQRLKREKQQQPKLQVLIYPWLQMFSFHLPSLIRNSNTGINVENLTEEIENNILVNNHTLLLEDEDLKKTLESYLDVDQIPEKYKIDKAYYSEAQKSFKLYPNYKLDDANILKSDKIILEFLKKTYDPLVSPLFAPERDLTGLPKAYFLIVDWDALKDEGILYSERLRKAGVDVQVAFYEKGFHGIASLIDHNIGYKLAREMLDDLVDFIKLNI